MSSFSPERTRATWAVQYNDSDDEVLSADRGGAASASDESEHPFISKQTQGTCTQTSLPMDDQVSSTSDVSESDVEGNEAGGGSSKQNPANSSSDLSDSDSDSDVSIFSDDDSEFDNVEDEFRSFRVTNRNAESIQLGSRRGKYTKEKRDMPPKTRKGLKHSQRYFTEPVWPARGNRPPITLGSYEKLEERLRGLLGYLDEITQGKCFALPKPRLEDVLFENRDRWLDYFRYLNDTRNLQVGTLAQHASMMIRVIEFLLHTTKVEERKPVYEKLLVSWRAFRNRLSRQHMAVIRSRDMDTDRANGVLLPTWQELVMVVGHLMDKVEHAPNAEKHVLAQDLCGLALFVLLPAMRSGIWRSLQLHQDAADDVARQRYLDSKCVNYLFYVERERAFTVRVNKDHKRNYPLVFYIRQDETPKVHDILLAYLADHRYPLLRTARHRSAGRDYLFFNPISGHPYDKASQIAVWITKVVRRGAGEIGLYPGRGTTAIKCNPHSFRHALYEYVRSANVPTEVRQSIAAACLHSADTAEQYYGKQSHEKKSLAGRMFVYETAEKILQQHQASATSTVVKGGRPHGESRPAISARPPVDREAKLGYSKVCADAEPYMFA